MPLLCGYGSIAEKKTLEFKVQGLFIASKIIKDSFQRAMRWTTAFSSPARFKGNIGKI